MLLGTVDSGFKCAGISAVARGRGDERHLAGALLHSATAKWLIYPPNDAFITSLVR
jgi:hypothetical protein